MDSLMQVKSLDHLTPQQKMWAALHQDYSHEYVWEEINTGKLPSDKKCGEIVVKRLLDGDRGHYGCYSKDTEVLTKKGWKFWPDVVSDDQLLAVDPDTGTSWFETPTDLQKVKFEEGDLMYQAKGTYIDLLVTKDHRMITSSRTSDKSGKGYWKPWEVRTAESCYKKAVRYMLSTCLLDSERSLPKDFPENSDVIAAFKLAGFFFGDGVRSSNKEPGCLRFRLRRTRKTAYLYSLGFPIEEKIGDRYTIRDKKLAKWIHKNFSNSKGKTIPDWLMTLPINAIAAFWDGLKNSDGTRVKENSWAYDSTELESLEKIQAAAHLNGFTANLTLNNKNEGIGHENHKPCWRLHISDRQTYRFEPTHKGRTPKASEAFVSYSGYVYCATVSTGALLVRRNGSVVVCGNCIEQMGITLACGYMPHSLMQQLRTHRISITFDCQSFRYTSKGLLKIKELIDSDIEAKFIAKELEKVVYLRPVGEYRDRKGKRYQYTEEQRQEDLIDSAQALAKYHKRVVELGFSEEHSRGQLPFDLRQHFVVSFNNYRSLMHMLDLRWKKDAQLEAQWFCDLLWEATKDVAPAVSDWYLKTRARKAKLSP